MIKFNEVSKAFGDVTALDRVSFAVEPKEFVFLIGPSGAGKTTLMKLILKELQPTSGTIEVDKTDLQSVPQKKIHEYRRQIGTVFQDFKLLVDRTVAENVALALKVLGKSETEINEAIVDVLKLVGLEQRLDFFPSQLSAGELQRVCLARAVVADPAIILADEPTGNLDLGTAMQIMKLLKKINEMGKTVLMTTHNFEIVNEMKERVIELKGGKLVSDQKKGKYPASPAGKPKNERTF